MVRVHRTVTPLIAPPPLTQLTQKEPNRSKVAKEVKLENLLPERELAARIPAPQVAPQKQFKAPQQNPAPPAPKPDPAILPPQELPRIDAAVRPPQNFPESTIPQPPPQIQPVEKPKLALEQAGQNGSSADKGGQPKIPIPKTSVEAALHSVARGGGQGGIVVGDADQAPSLGDALRQTPRPGKTASSLELLSDPMGVDFKPYLIRILAQVRRNWFAVIPESVRLGRRGKVTLQFAIDRSGGVPEAGNCNAFRSRSLRPGRSGRHQRFRAFPATSQGVSGPADPAAVCLSIQPVVRLRLAQRQLGSAPLERNQPNTSQQRAKRNPLCER